MQTPNSNPISPAIWLLVLGALFLSTSTSAICQEKIKWKLAHSEPGLEIFKQPTKTNGAEFKGILQANTTIEEVLKKLEDPASCQQWRFRCVHYVPLGDAYVYAQIDMPGIFKDRYAVMQVQRSTDKSSGTVTMTLTQQTIATIPKDIAAQLPSQYEDLLEMVEHSGKWILEPTGDNTVLITYQLQVNPGGNIPKSLFRVGSTKKPLNTLRNLRKALSTQTQMN